jgi:DMSO/TMAO reductase YedYZ molybdopterin-dependent catalytic subunit
MLRDNQHPTALTRRNFLRRVGIGAAAMMSAPPAWAQETFDFKISGGPSVRPITTIFPQKGRMILQRTSPPWLETPFDVFDKGVFTPNDQHYVSWHWATYPDEINVDTHRLTVRGEVNQPLSLSLKDIQSMPQFEIVAVNQCAGNSRMLMVPRVAGSQWACGSLSNAKWTGVRLKDVLDRAGVKAGAIQVRFGGLDEPVVSDAPKFLKSITVDHARDGEVMVAYGMNGEQLPMLNGFPLRVVVPGWSGVYWVKMLNDIEVLSQPDTNYWTSTGYRVPNAPYNNVKPGDKGFNLIPVTSNAPRSFITNIRNGDKVRTGAPTLARGIAFGGDSGVARVDMSIDGGKSWQPTELGRDEGKYSLRQWQTQVRLPAAGAHALMVRCTNTNGLAQPSFPVWNPAGYLYNTIESTHIIAD